MCEPTTIALIVGGALTGGVISSATGGDFGKGMLMGALTGGIGVGVTRAIDMSTGGGGGGLLGKGESSSGGNTTAAEKAAGITGATSNADANAAAAKTSEGQRSRIAALASQNIKTSSQGISPANTAKKTLLGQ